MVSHLLNRRKLLDTEEMYVDIKRKELSRNVQIKLSFSFEVSGNIFKNIQINLPSVGKLLKLS